MILRFLNAQGIAGLAVSICLALLLVLQKGETRHWKRQSGQFEQLYRGEQSALAGTIANFRAAAEVARAADRAAAERVAAEQRAINERTENAYEARLADARARADRLRPEMTGSPLYHHLSRFVGRRFKPTFSPTLQTFENGCDM